MTEFFVAIQFLTRLPTPLRREIGDEHRAGALAWFPAVGLFIGAVLVIVDHAASSFMARPVVDALLVTTMVAISGALHLDGLVDFVDGMAGGTDPATRLAAMRESTAGTAGAMAAVIALLASFVLIGALEDKARPVALLVAPLLSRGAVLLMYWRCPYARTEKTMSLLLKRGATNRRTLVSFIGVTTVLGVVSGPGALILLAVTGLVTVTIALIAVPRLRGITGDVCGAVSEVTQLGVLLTVPFALRLC